jgi:hypothetical protein
MATKIALTRIDVPITVRRVDEGDDVTVSVAGGHEGRFAAQLFETRADRVLILGELGLRHALAAARLRRAQTAARTLLRLVLDIHDRDLAGIAWEWPLYALLHEDEVVVRTSAVRARALSIPMTLPVRVIHVDPSQPLVRYAIERAMAGSEPGGGRIVDLAELPVEKLGGPSVERPTAEILHFDATRWPEDTRELLSTADPERAGTLGWLARLTERWQTRLVIIHLPRRREQRRPLAMLAAGLVARGGPAVVLAEATWDAPLVLYKGILDDEPLDAAILGPHPQGADALFMGGGREEALRISTFAEGLGRVEADVIEGRSVGGAQPLPFLAPDEHDELGEDAPAPSFRIADGGIHDLSLRLESLRDTAGRRGVQRLEDMVVAARRGRAGEPPQRYTSCSFWHEAGERNPVFVNPRDDRLRAGRIHHLAVQIGPTPDPVRVVDSTALLQEVWKLSDAENGTWIEVAITGLDFEVLGDPVQELWLPRLGPTERLHFAVRPRTPGASWLRVCLYHRNAVVQTIRVAAFVLEEGAEDAPPEVRQAALAAALGIPPEHAAERVGDDAYLLRVEYGEMPRFETLRRRPERALSIVANDANGRSVFTVKGRDAFGVRVDGTAPKLVENIRGALDRIETRHVQIGTAKDTQYLFGDGVHLNAGTEKQLADALIELATLGAQLYRVIASRSIRDGVAAALADGVHTIEIAHVLLEKAIPWAVVYTGPLDDGLPLQLCRAPLGAEGRSLPCGAHPTCVRKVRPELAEEQVVCPLRFWGFRHHLELPVRQIAEDGAPGAGDDGATPPVRSGQTLKIAAGIDVGLKQHGRHESDLEELVLGLPDAQIKPIAHARGEVLEKLEAGDLDVVYLYCHVERGAPAFRPSLVFRVPPEGKAIERIAHDQLSEGRPWEHGPLVFLNGCSTGGLLPDALSPFLVALVRDRRAGGVVSTEVAVWEPLASEFALHFLRTFLRGRSAGDALLDARWALLVQNNPLGLVYTLYAPVDLALQPAARGA